MSTLRLVLDTNVVLAALLFHQGSVSWIRDAWLRSSVRPLVSRETTNELVRVLAYPKFGLSDDDMEDLLDEYIPWCETVNVPADVIVPECRDPHDMAFLRLAITAEAKALVTGDRDLLALADEFDIPIIAPAVLADTMVETRSK